MTQQRIEIILKDVSLVIFQNLLVDFFSFDRSPDYPVYVDFDARTQPSKTPGYVAVEFSNFWIREAAQQDEQTSRGLANIIPQVYPPNLVVFIEGYEDESDNEKVERLVQKILVKALQLDYEVASVEPANLLPIGEQNKPTGMRMPKRKPGRPSHEDDIWAWQQVNEEHRPISEVKKEWAIRPGVIARDLLDPDRAFRKATDPNRPKRA